MRNFILSPEGQFIYAKGYATPILPSVEIPPEIQAKTAAGGGLRGGTPDRELAGGRRLVPGHRRALEHGRSGVTAMRRMPSGAVR